MATNDQIYRQVFKIICDLEKNVTDSTIDDRANSQVHIETLKTNANRLIELLDMMQ